MNDQTKSNSTEVDPIELDNPDLLTIYQIIKNTVIKLKDKTSVILWSSFVLLLLWGPSGNMELIETEWREAILPLQDFPWRDQLISFVCGFILLVVIPCCIIKFYFKESLSDYGLGWTNSRVKLGRLALIVTLLVCLPIFYFGTFHPDMGKEYPLFRDAVTTWGGFIVYQLVYFIFFINIEFIFRGYLLFGLFGFKSKPKEKESEAAKKSREGRYFGIYAILIQMLAYTMWHLSKPMPEYIGTIFWGVAVGAIALKIRSIWPIIIVHWLLNVWVDLLLWQQMP
ncbi:MAG: CPBP family intramembrane metalloprotease [bacterium]|nr:CPBP family intramembrane metalloprotease [bacterium]